MLVTPRWINLAGADDYIWHPIYDPVRNDPRWVKLMAEVGLTIAHARAQAWRKAHPPENRQANRTSRRFGPFPRTDLETAGFLTSLHPFGRGNPEASAELPQYRTVSETISRPTLAGRQFERRLE